MSDLTERAEKLAHLMDVSVVHGIPWRSSSDDRPRLTARGIAATLRALVEENRKLREAATFYANGIDGGRRAREALTPPTGGEVGK